MIDFLPMLQSAEIPTLDFKNSLKKAIQFAFSAGVLATLYTLSMPNYYRSETRLLPVEPKGAGGLGGLAAAATAFGMSVPGGDSSDLNFVDILNSRSVREQLLSTEFQYHMRSWRFGHEQARKCTLYSHLGVSNMDQAVGSLGGILVASRDPRSKVITISAETVSPDLSQGIVQRASRLLELFLQEKGRTRGGAKAAFAELRLAEARQEMDEAEESLRRFLETNRNYLSSADPSVRLKGSRLESELRLRQQLVTTIAMNREQALLDEKNDIPILNVMDPGNLPIEKSRPSRSPIIIIAALAAGMIRWLWYNRTWVKIRLSALENGPAK